MYFQLRRAVVDLAAFAGYCVKWAAWIHGLWHLWRGIGWNRLWLFKWLTLSGSAQLLRVQWLGWCGFHVWGHTRWAN